MSNASMLLPWSTSDEADRLAARWGSKAAFPPEVAALLDTNPKTAGATLLLGIPRHRVPLTGGECASDTDLWVLGRTTRGLISMTIERDARPVERAPAMDPPLTDRHLRWAAVSALLEIDRPCDPPLPARFFHRTAAALLEARRFFAVGAAVIVHAFDATHDSFADFQRFVTLMGAPLLRTGELVEAPPREGIELFFGWADAIRA